MRIRFSGPGEKVTALNVPVYLPTEFTCYIPEFVDKISNTGVPTSKPTVNCSGNYIAQEGIDYTVEAWKYSHTTGSGPLYRAWIRHKLAPGIPYATVGFLEFLRNAPLKSATSEEVSCVFERETAEMHDVVTPSYKKDSALGRVIMSPMKRFTVFQSVNPHVVSTPNSVKSYKNPWYGTYSATMERKTAAFALSCPLPIYPTLPSADSVIAEAFAKLQKADLDVAMMAAEGKETLAYLKVLALRALKLYELFASPKTIMKVAPKTYARLKKLSPEGRVDWTSVNLAQAWLELRYALRPLLMDIESIVSFFLDPKKAKKDRQTFRRRQVTMGQPEKLTIFNGIPGEFIRTVDYDVSAGVLAELVVDSTSNSFGFTNWASVIWEKIPYSFIVDWIVNISGLLYMLNPNCTWKVLGGWSTVSATETVTGLVPVVGPDGNTVKTQFLSRISVKERTVNITRPPLISISVDIDTFKMLDLAALARGIKWNHSTLRL